MCCGTVSFRPWPAKVLTSESSTILSGTRRKSNADDTGTCIRLRNRRRSRRCLQGDRSESRRQVEQYLGFGKSLCFPTNANPVLPQRLQKNCRSHEGESMQPPI